jgi:hypothetical protein
MSDDDAVEPEVEAEAEEEEIEPEPEPTPIEVEDRLTLKVGNYLLQELRQVLEVEGLSDRVRFAAELALIAACERAGRAMRRDLPGDKG